MNELLEESREIVNQAIADYKPYAVVLMLSGGRDSMLAYQVARALNIKLDFIMHGWTRTGIVQTTEFVRQFAASSSIPYIEADAGSNYEDYVLRKGFFGRGKQAHAMTYHVLKAGPFRKAISKQIRQRQQGRKVLFLNGARKAESTNRANNMQTATRVDSGCINNLWVNICHHWKQRDRDTFLQDVKAPINPVTVEICRSGECMCGSAQTKADRLEAAAVFPDWGKWLADLENEVYARGFKWGWGEDTCVKNPMFLERNGQMRLVEDDQFMCVSCKVGANEP